MVKVIDKKRINFIPRADQVVVMNADEFEDILEQTDPKFQNSLKQSLKEYKNKQIVSLKDL